MKQPTLGYCEYCGHPIAAVWYRDDKEIVLSHGSCTGCFKNIIVPQMTQDEYADMARRLR